MRWLVCGLLCLALAAGPAPATAPAPIIIRVGLVPNDDAATPLLYAQSAGLFAKAGIDLRLELQTSGAAVKLIGVQSLNDLNQIATDAWVDRHGGDPGTLRFVELPMVAGVAALKGAASTPPRSSSRFSIAR